MNKNSSNWDDFGNDNTMSATDFSGYTLSGTEWSTDDEKIEPSRVTVFDPLNWFLPLLCQTDRCRMIVFTS